jgi:ribosome biogenesis GTPase
VPDADAIALEAIGWDDSFAAHVPQGARPARVARIDRGRATLLGGDESYAELGGHVVAVGDWVLLRNGVIADLLPRRSAFVRGDTIEGVAREAQVVAANVDVVFVVHALSNRSQPRRLERELVLAFESGARPVVVLNKADLATEAEIATADVVAHNAAVDIDVIVTSARDDRGLDALHACARPHKTVALIGASGVGKSSLANRLLGSEAQATGAVRESDQRGRHTTTARELAIIPGGGVLIDTPGLRSVALWESEDGFNRVFSDIEELALQCRFRDCAHGAEPGCAVQDAITRGALLPERLDHYRKLAAELDARR